MGAGLVTAERGKQNVEPLQQADPRVDGVWVQGIPAVALLHRNLFEGLYQQVPERLCRGNLETLGSRVGAADGGAEAHHVEVRILAKNDRALQAGMVYLHHGVFALLIQHPAGAILHHGSAGFKPQMYDGTHADVILLGIAGRGNTDQYLENVVLKTRARLVLPIHMDNFFKPLENGMSLLPTVRFGEFCRKTENHRLSFTMNTLPFCNEVGILPLDEIPKTQRMLQSKNQI